MDPLMGTDVGVFQVADAPTYGYVYTLPFNNSQMNSLMTQIKDKVCYSSYNLQIMLFQ